MQLNASAFTSAKRSLRQGSTKRSFYFAFLLTSSPTSFCYHPAYSKRLSSHIIRSKMQMIASGEGTEGLGWSELIERTVLPLTEESHKGSSGRIGVVGGSIRFTGAPYYASMAALKVGSDLATVFCASEASIPIKCYSPELMVMPVYDASKFDFLVKSGESRSNNARDNIDNMVKHVVGMFPSLHALVCGPGLGRCPLVLEATSQIIRKAVDEGLPLVIDADALYLLSLPEYQDLLKPSSSADMKGAIVLTPNLMELRRLEGKDKLWDKDRVVVVQKGLEDCISYTIDKESKQIKCSDAGGLRRCGGIGDILSGTIGTFLAWNNIMAKSGDSSNHDVPLACWMATSLVKRATNISYQQHQRAMTAPDILNCLGPTFHKMTQCESDGA